MHAYTPPALAHMVDAIWEVEGTVVNTGERIFPNGTIDVVTNLGPEQRLVQPDGIERFATGDTWLSGIQLQPLVMQSQRDVHVFGIRLRAGAAASVLSAPMALAAGHTVRLRDVRREAANVIALVADGSRTFVDRAAAVCAWIEHRCGTNPHCIGHVDWIARRLEEDAGAVRIETLRRAAGVSRKTVAADFRDRIGATPKAFARILRFRHARLLLQQQSGSPAAIAAACGYFDQSHMVRDFRDLGGMTPGAFVAAAYPDGLSATT